VDTAELVTRIEEAFIGAHIRTYVIGLPGSEPIREALTLAAIEGGSAADCPADAVCHWDLSATQDLASALTNALAYIAADIAARLAPVPVCTMTVPQPPPGRTIDRNKVSVLIHSAAGESRLILQDEIGACSEGWRWISESEFEFCPETCDRLSEPGTGHEAVFGCTPCAGVDC
jgi:hypothetical protein